MSVDTLELVSDCLELLGDSQLVSTSISTVELADDKDVYVAIDIGGTKCMLAYGFARDLDSFAQSRQRQLASSPAPSTTSSCYSDSDPIEKSDAEFDTFISSKVFISKRFDYQQFSKSLGSGILDTSAICECTEAQSSSLLLNASMLQRIILHWLDSTPIGSLSLVVKSVTVSLCGLVDPSTALVTACECPALVGVRIDKVVRDSILMATGSYALFHADREGAHHTVAVNVVNDAQCAMRAARMRFPAEKNMAVIVTGTGIASAFLVDGVQVTGAHQLGGFLGACPYTLATTVGDLMGTTTMPLAADSGTDDNEETAQTDLEIKDEIEEITAALQAEMAGLSTIEDLKLADSRDSIDTLDEIPAIADIPTSASGVEAEEFDDIVSTMATIGAEDAAADMSLDPSEVVTQILTLDEACGGRSIVEKLEYAHNEFYVKRVEEMVSGSLESMLEKGPMHPEFWDDSTLWPKGTDGITPLSGEESTNALLEARIEEIMHSTKVQFNVADVCAILGQSEHPLRDTFSAIISEATDAFAFALCTALNMMNPRRLVLAGGVLQFGSFSEESLSKCRDLMLFTHAFDKCTFTLWQTTDAKLEVESSEERKEEVKNETERDTLEKTRGCDNLVVLGALFCNL